MVIPATPIIYEYETNKYVYTMGKETDLRGDCLLE